MPTPRRVHFAIAAACGLFASHEGAPARAHAQTPNSGPNPYDITLRWWTVPEEPAWVAGAGIGLDREGRVWAVCQRGPCTDGPDGPIVAFDRSGKRLKNLGARMFVTPHGVFVDHEGNVWVTDANGRDGKGHQVFKFSPDGKVLMTLGKAGVAGEGPDTFNRPTDVVVAPNGDIFVADGHGGDTVGRIVKFTKDGKFLKTWGKVGSGPGEFKNPHALAFDATGRLFVADRTNSRIQIFDQEGTFLTEWKQFGEPSDVYINNGVLFVPDIGLTRADKSPGTRGIRIGSAKDGTVTAFVPAPTMAGSEVPPEGIVQDADGSLFVTSPRSTSVQKYALRR